MVQVAKGLSEQDMIPHEKLPSKAERKADKNAQDKADKEVEVIKNLLKEFVNEKIIPLDVPVSTILDAVPQLLTALIKIYATKSTAYGGYLTAKRKYEETAMKDLVREQ
jgi:6-phosphogluconate dehydrogenase (decarboxylating)